MTALVQLIWSLCNLKAGPDRMPYSPILLILLTVLQFCLDWYQFYLQPDIKDPLLPTVLVIGLFVSFTGGLFYFTDKSNRFVQTASSLFAINFFINLLHFPVYWLAKWLMVPGLDEVLLFIFTLLLLIYIIALNIWLIIITAHIFAKALEKPFLTGLLVTIAMLGVNVVGFALFLN